MAGASLDVSTASASNAGIVIRGAASQTANLQEWQNSAGSILAQITSAGDLVGNSLFAVRTRYILSVANTGAYLDSNSVGNSLVVFQRVATAVNLIVKGAASQTADLQQWQDSAGTVLASVTSGGNIATTGAVSINTAGTGTVNLGDGSISKSPGAGFSFNSGISASFLGTGGASATSLIPLFVAFQSATAKTVIRGAASQTANLQEWQNSAGGLLLSVDSSGNLVAPSASTTAARFRYFDGTGASGTYIDTQAVTGSLSMIARSTTAASVIVKGAASQTGDLQQWQNSAGTVLVEVTSTGGFELNGKDIELMTIMQAL
jgi:hypothetical protein